jgi:hypothetical protein
VEVHHHGTTGLTHVTDPQYPPAATYLHLAHLTIVTPPATQGNETATGLARRQARLAEDMKQVSKALDQRGHDRFTLLGRAQRGSAKDP